ncbi:MAG TPA: hypothetical protein VN420_01870 [Candidatus Fimivivens sp.]|nr:hypothetical protein [Candidatus Fimivivens sp.]
MNIYEILGLKLPVRNRFSYIKMSGPMKVLARYETSNAYGFVVQEGVQRNIIDIRIPKDLVKEPVGTIDMITVTWEKDHAFIAPLQNSDAREADYGKPFYLDGPLQGMAVRCFTMRNDHSAPHVAVPIGQPLPLLSAFEDAGDRLVLIKMDDNGHAIKKMSPLTEYSTTPWEEILLNPSGFRLQVDERYDTENKAFRFSEKLSKE